MEFSALLIKLRAGSSLSENELGQIADFLSLVNSSQQPAFDVSADEIYEAVLLLGRARAKEHRELIEHYLHSKDPTTVCLVIEILCEEWDETEEHLERLLHFALGMPWDLDGDVQSLAVKLIGHFLVKRFEQALNEYSRLNSLKEKTEDLPAIETCFKGKTSNDQSKLRKLRKRESEVLRLLFNLYDDSDLGSAIRDEAFKALFELQHVLQSISLAQFPSHKDSQGILQGNSTSLVEKGEKKQSTSLGPLREII